MNEINVKSSLESPQEKNIDINICAENLDNEKLLYKFLVGKDGTWKTLRDFNYEDTVVWSPKEDGRYIIMIQGKSEKSTKGFDYIGKTEYIIGKEEEKLIKNVYIDKDEVKLGEKITVTVEGNKVPLVYRYWVREENKWELIKDYSADNVLSWTVLKPGIQEILVECRDVNSNNNCDDFDTISFSVKEIGKLEIVDFKCLTKNILKGKEILFQVNSEYEDNRMILYKFIRIDSFGKAKCIQDYSTKRTVSYIEDEKGEFRLLCLAKDMYSPSEFDDRAVIFYKVKEYEKIKIQAFTTDVSSPQICGAIVGLKAIAKGGENLLYRFKIEGPYSEDSTYIKENKYIWKPEKKGVYKVHLFVKDKSFSGEFETKDYLEFTVDEISREDVKIENIIYERKDVYLQHEAINIEVDASGGMELKYSFVVRKDNKETERIEYGSCNWANFTPDECGVYELEIRVRDKYSKRDYDTHSVVNLEVKNYIPSNIDYVLLEPREIYMVGDDIKLEVICQNTMDTLVKYKLKINGHELEETDFTNCKKYNILPRCKGLYELNIFSKSKKSIEEYDCKKTIKISVEDSLPVTKTKIRSDKIKYICNECVDFSVTSEGGKDVIYEFYLMEKNEWKLVQKYSKKINYSFIPFSKGLYRLIVLAKSIYKKQAYEDYDEFEFYVDEVDKEDIEEKTIDN
ncbi:triple tyrosine motif-containing protein [Haloimpatiens sp. FM7315]|uniref:triple tyrosine motif-containing protein n=1 Tax=Haloimpatiens sp. FM7315 TaxID=3298609 RepID=UPI0035A3C85E